MPPKPSPHRSRPLQRLQPFSREVLSLCRESGLRATLSGLAGLRNEEGRPHYTMEIEIYIGALSAPGCLEERLSDWHASALQPRPAPADVGSFSLMSKSPRVSSSRCYL